MNLGFEIVGMGKALPKTAIASSLLDKKLGLRDGYLEDLTGLKCRYFLQADESVDDLILSAVAEALAQAGLTIDDVDCVISASATMLQALPYNAASICRLLGGGRCVSSFDINMTCLSALRALEVAAGLFARYPKILIVSCDIASVGLDWRDLHTAGIFGDGAAAMVVTRPVSDFGGILCANFETYSEGYEFCQILGGGARYHPSRYVDYESMGYFRMNGKKLYKLSADILPSFLKRTLQAADLDLGDLDWVVPHQASRSALLHIVRRLKIPKDKVVDIFEVHGNQVAASIPTALYHLLRDYPVRSGDKVLIAGTSAGVGLGAMVWELP